MLTTSNIILISYIISFLLICTIVFFQRRDPIVCIAWVLCFIVFPIIGQVIFLIFGLGMKRRTKRIYQKKQSFGEHMSLRLNEQLDALNKDLIKEFPDADIVRYFCHYNSLLSENNNVEIITDGKEKFDKLLEDIENATESINLLYFIIRKDEIGTKIMNALIKKANEGVTVRLLYDSIGCFFTPNKFLNQLNNTKCGKAASFFPVTFFGLSRINHRNHRKIVVIDNKIAYLGGMNIGDEYMSEKKLSPWRDTHLKITGEAVKLVYKYFCLDWDFSTHDNLTDGLDELYAQETIDMPKPHVPMQIVASGPDSESEEIKCGMIKLLNTAKEYVYIQTPYFVPDKAFLNALVMAVDSGVDVRLMIPGKPDKKYVYYSTMSYIDELMASGIKIYLYDGFIHSKTMVTDDKLATIGTTNIDIRSFQLHFEINAFLYSPAKATECRRIFEKDMENSKLLTEEEYNKRGWLFKLKEGLFRLFSPIM